MIEGTLIQDIGKKDAGAFCYYLVYKIILFILGKNALAFYTLLFRAFKKSIFCLTIIARIKKHWGQAWIYCPI